MNVVTELLSSSLRLRPKVIVLGECPLENGDWIHIEGYTCYANTEATKYGCAVYIANEYVHMFVVERITSQFTTLWTEGTEITMGYQRPKTKSFDPNNEWHRNSNNIVIADLNAKHTKWSAGTTDTAGNYLNKWLNERNLKVLNPFAVTHPPSSSHPTGTTIDLVIANAHLKVTTDHLIIPSSDHLAILVNAPINWRNSGDRPLRYDKAKWDMIGAELLLMDEKDTDPTSVQRQLSDITLRHTPRANPKAKAFWSKELDAQRRRVLKEVRNRPTNPQIPAMKKAYKKAIAKAKHETNARSLQEETDPECFRTVKARTTRHPIPALIRKNNTIAAEHQHIAQELQDALYEGEHRRPLISINQKPTDQLNIGNLNAAIKQSPNGAATGPDFITTRMLKLFSKTREKLFLETMNVAWTQGIPDSWKLSNTILIPKARKPTYTTAKSWRPIQLQSILAKTMERIAVQKIADLCLLGDNMHGGRKKNGTTDAIQALDTVISSRSHPHACITTLDIEGGFDHLPMEKVCQSLANNNKHLSQWVTHWAANRTTSYRFNGKSSKAFATDKGTPQGSPLSPILFLLSVRDMASTPTPNTARATTSILTYIDDFLIATTYKEKTHGQKDHQATLQALQDKGKECGYTFAATKSEHIHIKTPAKSRLEPRINNLLIQQRETLRWLGYHIDEKYNWKHHIREWTKKAMRTGYNLKALTTRYQTGGLNTWTTLRIIKGLIIPQLTYGIEVWDTKGPIREAQTVLNNIVRKAFGLETKTPLAAIYTELGIPPLLLYAKNRQTTLALRAETQGRHTNWSEKWLNASGVKQNILTALDSESGKKMIKATLLREWQNSNEKESIRYEGRPRTSYKHLKGTTREEFRDILYLRATAAWPYQDTDGKRRQCPCDRDIITPDHLMTRCGVVKNTTIPLHSAKRQRELIDWMKTWPESLRDRPTRRWNPNAGGNAQVQGAMINLPTSQPTVGPRGGKPKSRKPCDICGFLMQRDKVAQEKHARTHEPKAQGRGKKRGV